MKIFDHVHQLELSFYAAPNVRRSVFLYLLEGEHCYLIDTGIRGAEDVILDDIAQRGYVADDLRSVFLTHAHPDHIGAAYRLKQLTGCSVYSSAGDQPWIADIDVQFRARPIPNFYQLVSDSVTPDGTLSDGDTLCLDADLTLRVLETPGHSQSSLSYLWLERGILFTGDCIPSENDVPIYENAEQSIRTLLRLQSLSGIHAVCPAWDRIYAENKWQTVLQRQIDRLRHIQSCTEELIRRHPASSFEQLFPVICEQLGVPELSGNPMFRRTIASHFPPRV